MAIWMRMRPFLTSRILVGFGYFMLALWSTWPLAKSPTCEMPVGIVEVTTVPLLNVWTIWWNSDRIQHAFAGYWNAPIFHPTLNTFAFSEPQPTTLLVAPVIWITGSRVLAYNIYLWMSLVLNGIFTERLLRIVGVGRQAAICGGMAMLLLPIVHWQLDVLQLIPLWGILWTWTSCYQAAYFPSWKRGVEVGIAFSVAFMTCGHHGLFLATLLTGTVWILLRSCFRIRTWLTWGCAGGVVLVLAGPMILHMRQVLSPQDFDRNPSLVEQLSVQPGDYLPAAGVSFYEAHSGNAEPFWRLSPGWIKVGLATLGGVLGLLRRRWRRWSIFLLITAVLAFLLSMGTHLRIGEWQPWWTLTHVLPGLSRVRNVFRFAFFVQMVVVLLTAQCLFLFTVLIHRYCRSRFWRVFLKLAVFGLGLLAVFEVRPAKVQLRSVPEYTANQNWVSYVRKETSPGKAVACLPFPTGESVGDFESAAQWMYMGTFHGRPLVNGYSGFFTREYFELQDALGNSWPTEEALRKLLQSDVEFLVVNTWVSPIRNLHVVPYQSVKLERVLQDPARIEIYRLSYK